MKRLFSFFLATAMTAVLLICPAAASSPWVEVGGQGTASQTLQVRGLTENYNGVQLTLELSQAVKEFRFDDSFSGDGRYGTFHQEGTSITLYAAAKAPLNQGDTIFLGTILADQGFTVRSVSGLKLIFVGPDSTEEFVVDNVPINSGGSSGGGSGDEDDSDSSTGYTISVPAGTGNGEVRLSNSRAKQGETVTVTAAAKKGYVLSVLTVFNSAGRTVKLTDLGGGKYSFVMPAGAVTVKASFVPAEEALPFDDVGENDWFREAAAYVYGAGLMNGTGPNSFGPNGTTTRGMIVTILHRLEGAPAEGSAAFPDVAADAYYAGPVAWAAKNGIVEGYDNGEFRPDRNITREQLAAILYRYARYKGLDVNERADLSGFGDVSVVSAYALEAMAWANGTGLITGVDESTLRPGGSATRAQAATILMRFCENVAK